MNEKDRKKILGLEENALKEEMNIEKWQEEIKERRKKINDSRRTIKKINTEINEIKYAEVIQLIQKSELDPAEAFAVIKRKVEEKKELGEIENE